MPVADFQWTLVINAFIARRNQERKTIPRHTNRQGVSLCGWIDLIIKPLPMITLIRQLQAFSPMSNDLINHFYEIVEEKEAEKKSYLLKAGKICQNVFYIKKGLIRCYLKGKEEEEQKESRGKIRR